MTRGWLPLLLLTGCVPLFRAVPLGGPTQPLPEGHAQGPFKLTVPLDTTHPHRVSVHLASRCTPLFRVELHSKSRGVLLRALGASDSTWQDLLRQRFVTVEAATPAPASHTEPEREPGVNLALAGGGALSPRGTAGSATATASVTLPGRWVAQTTFDERFELERQRRCATEGGYTVAFPEPFEAGEPELEIVLWAEVPQLLEQAHFSVDVEQLDPPAPPREDSRSPATGATWREGSFSWFHDNATDWGWRWIAGRWLEPATPPPLRVERTGEPPNPGQTWATGHWRWAGRAGWEWVSGRWTVPAAPPGAPPPARDEAPTSTCRYGTWGVGHWAWALDRGWVWRSGSWSVHAVPQPAPREEQLGAPPNAGQVWARGAWQWCGCDGWSWVSGHWNVPVEPPGPPPPPKLESPSWVRRCSAAVWQPGSWRWSARIGWEWSSGRWLESTQPTSASPTTVESDTHGDPPNPGQEWARGSWQWNSCEGWRWSGGCWVVPDAPTSKPPPPRAESAEPRLCSAATWQAGTWRWSSHVGWEWAQGTWRLSPKPVSPPPPDTGDDAHQAPPWPGQEWAPGSWGWDGCHGWVWNRGDWVVPLTPKTAPPPPLEERPDAPVCRAASWQRGTWGWSTSVGWEWTPGEWRTSGKPTVPQPAMSTAAPGHWDWKACEGWVWASAPEFVPAPWPTQCEAPMAAPPSPRVEAQPPVPIEGSVWIPGAWVWTRCKWNWGAGRWHQPPQPGMVWVPGPTIELGRWAITGAAR